MNQIKSLPKILVVVTTLGLMSAAPAYAENRVCAAFLKELSSWPENVGGYDLVISAAMDPSILAKLNSVDEKRAVTKGLSKKISSLYHHIFVTECQQNPAAYSYTASIDAARKTKEIIKKYLDDRD
ncbi:MAG: hypothetical protein V7629_00830 [Motiliproteus sp.]